MRKRAFTLIELLVVIAIIAILAAILFPVFAQAKLSAKKAVDLSNMKQIALGIFMYSGDHDDTPPQVSYEFGGTAPPQSYNPGGKYQVHFTYLLQPYIHNWAIWLSPQDLHPVQATYECATTADIGQLNASGQMYCDWQADNSYIPAYNIIPAHDWIPVTLTIIPAPSNTIAMADRRNNFEGTGAAFSGKKGLSGFNPSQPCTQEGAVLVPSQYNLIPITSKQYAFWTADEILQHEAVDTSDKADVCRVWYNLYFGGGNYAFADGHAKYQNLAQTLVPTLGKYEYGDTFYPSINPEEGVSCVGGG